MSTFITTKTFHEVRKNGKVVKKKMLDATYDGNTAVIDTLENDKAHRFELSAKDMKKFVKQLIINNKKNINVDALKGSSSIKEHLLTLNEKSSNKSKSKNKSNKNNKNNKHNKKRDSRNSTRGKHHKRRGTRSTK